MSEMTATTMKTKNKIFAMPAAPLAMPPNPKMAAMIATTKNTMASLRMGFPS